MSSQSNVEPIYYYITREWYKGPQPNFYDPDQFPAAAIMRDNYEAIKEEVMSFYKENGAEMTSNYTPYNYHEKGWKTATLYSYFLKYPSQCKKFPVIDRVANSIPGMCLAQVSVLEPGVRLKAHFGDTNAIVRNHLGLRIPGKHPDLGLRIRNEERAWKEGDVMSFSIVNRHYAWNSTNQYRIILMIDFMLPEYMHKCYLVAGNTLAAIAMKHAATRFPILKKMPDWLTLPIHRMLGLGFWALIRMQRAFL